MFCDLSRKECWQIADKFCQHFKIPEVKKIIITKEKILYEGKEYYAFYEWDNNLIEIATPVKLFVFLHELTHHLQNHHYCNRNTHGNKFVLAKNRVVTWARNSVCLYIQPSNLNGFID